MGKLNDLPMTTPHSSGTGKDRQLSVEITTTLLKNNGN